MQNIELKLSITFVILLLIDIFDEVVKGSLNLSEIVSRALMRLSIVIVVWLVFSITKK